MKKLRITSLVIFTLAITFLSFNLAVTNYKVDSSKSTLVWTGKKVTGEHTGNIKLSNGTIGIDGQNIKSGSFDIDMNSITCTDITDETYNGKFVGHLKSDDFFSTEKFSKSSFVLTQATNKGNGNYDITGKLTIKGITNEIKFPATVKVEGGKLTAKAKIAVDRTKYDIKYGSGSFFDNLGDKAIENDFTMDVTLVANK